MISVWISRGDRIHPDAVRTEFARHRLRQPEDAGLGGAVVRPAEDAAAALGGDRRQTDDRARFALAHVRNHRLRHVERTAQADVGHRLIVLRLDFHELQRLGDAGVIDEHVDAPERAEHLIDRGLALLQVGNVAGKSDMLIAHFGRSGLRLLGVEIENGHPCALAGEQLGRGHAEPAPRRRTRDDAALVFKQHVPKTQKLAPLLG